MYNICGLYILLAPRYLPKSVQNLHLIGSIEVILAVHGADNLHYR